MIIATSCCCCIKEEKEEQKPFRWRFKTSLGTSFNRGMSMSASLDFLGSGYIVRTSFEIKDGKGPPTSSPSPPLPSIGLVEIEVSGKTLIVYIHLVPCWRLRDHLKEHEEDLSLFPSKLHWIETLQETLKLERKTIDNRIIDEEKEQHLQSPQITLFVRPTSCSCLSLLDCLTPLPNPSFSTNISLCIQTLIWHTYIIVTT